MSNELQQLIAEVGAVACDYYNTSHMKTTRYDIIFDNECLVLLVSDENKGLSLIYKNIETNTIISTVSGMLVYPSWEYLVDSQTSIGANLRDAIWRYIWKRASAVANEQNKLDDATLRFIYDADNILYVHKGLTVNTLSRNHTKALDALRAYNEFMEIYQKRVVLYET